MNENNTALLGKLLALAADENYPVQNAGKVLLALHRCTESSDPMAEREQQYLLVALQSVQNLQNVTRKTEWNTFEGHVVLASGIRFAVNEMVPNVLSPETLFRDIGKFTNGKRHEVRPEVVVTFLRHCIEGIEEQCEYAKRIYRKEKPVLY